MTGGSLRAAARHLVLGLALLAGGAAPATEPAGAPAESEALRALGQRLYREGLRPSGVPLTANGAARTRLQGQEAACITCHRRSGFGSSEGQIAIRPVTGPALLQAQATPLRSPRVRARLGSSVRPPYDEALLARALRSGVDAAGKALGPAMPRYDLGDEEVRALAAYLFTLSAQPSPGVDAQEIHFAAVIQPGVAPDKRRAMLEVMRAFARDKDANVRQQEQRRAAGTMRMDRAYRKWVLHDWELSGPSEGWAAQLEARYREQPVFALIGGLGTESWAPIQAFSERHEIPAVLPQVDLPTLAGSNQYTLYFSRGVTLEAEILARFLREQGGNGRIVQVLRREPVAVEAAAAFRSALGPEAADRLDELVLTGPADPAFWQQVAARQPQALVLWLEGPDLEQLAWPGAPGLPVYLSFSLSAGQRPAPALKSGASLRLVYPSDLPPRHEARLLRGRHWLLSRGIAPRHESVQLNTLFTLAIVSDVIGHLADSFSRDFFVERLEHAVGQTPMPSIYPQLSLGPGQRYAAKGGQIVELLAEGGTTRALSGWIVP